ncbi:hypothetical protein [Jiella marina]|uniref:hypothetical protein n=1 Tax=Jiella sp. LLJ827 TaxID=2917712 RepID=UPI0021009360|nr:hypothetical protein [Jiella sp. LLJ827]MCQ0988912.1 hypothetical protein [Jiella sp. LLJ827]
MSIAACAALMIFAGSPRPAEAQSILKLGQANETPKTGCAGRYHQALAEVKGREYAAVETAKSEAASGDASLPGRMIFNPIAPPRERLARRALQTANQLARTRNQPAWQSSSDAKWIIKEVSNELGRYLGQEETPFLCGGVPAYLETMRSYLARAGANADSAEELFQAQAAVAQESIRDTLELMKPVPIPQSAPADRGRMSLTDLRPAAGIGDRSEVIESATNANGSDLAADTDPNPTNATAQAPETAPSEPAFDPDLPPLKAPDPIPLRSDADRLQVLASLMEATERGNFLSDPTTTASFEMSAEPRAEASQLATIRPVLARLQELRPLVYGARPAIRDLTLRRALIQSFWAIEVLDYLDHRPAEAADSVPSAIGRTLSAIETAHRANCGCD